MDSKKVHFCRFPGLPLLLGWEEISSWDFAHTLRKWGSCYLNVYHTQDTGLGPVPWLCTVTRTIWPVHLKGRQLFGHVFDLWKSHLLDFSTVFGIGKPVPVLHPAFWGTTCLGGDSRHIYFDFWGQSGAVGGDQACSRNCWLRDGSDQMSLPSGWFTPSSCVSSGKCLLKPESQFARL